MQAILRVGLGALGGTLFVGTAYITAISYAPAPTYSVSDVDRQNTFEQIAPTYYNQTKNQEFYLGIRKMRRNMAKEARGVVLEVGAGTGTMVGMYPAVGDETSSDGSSGQQQQQQLLSKEEQEAKQKKRELKQKNDPLAGIVDANAEKEMTNTAGGYVSPGVSLVVMSDRAENMVKQLETKIEGRIGYAPEQVLESDAKLPEKWNAEKIVKEFTKPGGQQEQLVAKSGEKHPLYQVSHFASECIPFPDNSFDTVVDVFGLCSYDDPVKALMEMSRVCKPDGRLLLLEHGKGTWSRVNMQLDKWAPRHAKSWGCWWNRDIRRYLRLAGLKVLRREERHLGTTQKLVVKPNKTWMTPVYTSPTPNEY